MEKGHPRNDAVLVMRKKGLVHRKKILGDHRRSLAETAMSRFKQNHATKIQLSGKRSDGVCEHDKQIKYTGSTCQKAPNVTVTWGRGSHDLLVDLGNNV